jgi:tetratricopeptide (TPR) repeat protein
VVPAIAATVLAAGAAIFVATRGSGRVCEPVSPADVWSDARVAELRAHAVPDDVIATMTKRFAEVDALRTSSCEDREAGKLGSVQHGTIAVCLDRLVIEYDERIKATLAKPDRATNLLGSPPTAEDCRNRRDTVFDPKKQREIIARFIASVVAPRDELRRELVALMPMAVEAGDHELAARLADLHGSELAVQRDLSGARKAMQQARAYAQQSGSAMTELRVVTQHLKIERFHDNLALARLLANDAKVLIERVPAGTPYAEQTMLEIATLATARGEYPEARDYNRRLLEILEKTNRGNGSAALERRIQIVNITPQLDEPSPPDFKKFIEDTQVLLDKVYTDKSKSGYRAGLFALAEGYRAIKDPRADKLIEAGLDLLRDEKPEPGNSVLAHRATIAGQLFVRDRQDEAIGILRDVVRESGRADANDVAAANKRFTHTFGLALMLFATDQSGEAHAMAEDALLEITGKLGPNHAETRQVLELLVLIELERKDFARAEKHIDAIERALRAEPSAEGSASTTILHASVARLRGDLATAEKLAREALTTATEIRARGSLLQTANRELGRVLVALGRDAEALPYLIAGLPAANQFGIRDCIAEFEVAKVERAVGKRAEGDARAKSCLAHIKGVKSFAPRRREVEAWLAAP